MERPPAGDDPGEIETGDVIKRDPQADLAGDPGEIEVIEVREGQREVGVPEEPLLADLPPEPPADAGEPPPETSDERESDPGEVELEEVVGDTGREIGAG